MQAISNNQLHPTLSEAARLFLLAKRVKGKSRFSLEWWGWVLKSFGKHLTAQFPVEEVDASKIREYLAAQEDRGVFRKTLWDHRNGLKTFFRWCVAEGILGKDPSEPIKAVRIPRRSRSSYLKKMCSGY